MGRVASHVREQSAMIEGNRALIARGRTRANGG
jgi:hypothetical protein